MSVLLPFQYQMQPYPCGRDFEIRRLTLGKLQEASFAGLCALQEELGGHFPAIFATRAATLAARTGSLGWLGAAAAAAAVANEPQRPVGWVPLLLRAAQIGGLNGVAVLARVAGLLDLPPEWGFRDLDGIVEMSRFAEGAFVERSTLDGVLFE